MIKSNTDLRKESSRTDLREESVRTDQNDLVEVTEDYGDKTNWLVKIKYLQRPLSEIYIPEFVRIKLYHNCKIVIDDIASISTDILEEICKAMHSAKLPARGEIHGSTKCINCTWSMEYCGASDVMIVVINLPNSLQFRQKIKCTADHIFIFDNLLTLKKCLEKKERFVTQSKYVKVIENDSDAEDNDDDAEDNDESEEIVMIKYRQINPQIAYVPKLVKFRLSNECIINIDDFLAVSVADLEQIIYDMNGINGKNHITPPRICGSSEDKKTGWIIGYNYHDQTINIVIDFMERFLLEQKIKCTDEHLKIFGVLLELRKCIERKERYATKTTTKLCQT